jgi:hypothetical protein
MEAGIRETEVEAEGVRGAVARPTSGRIASLKDQSWFTDMAGKEQKRLSSLASGTVKGLLKYYRTARKIIDRRSP